MRPSASLSRFVEVPLLTSYEPVFGDHTMTPEEKRDIIAFLKTTEDEPSPGGASLGKLGPVTEGGIGWLVGIGGLIGCAVWLGAKAR